MSAVLPALSSLSTRTGISFVSGATPAIPVCRCSRSRRWCRRRDSRAHGSRRGPRPSPRSPSRAGRRRSRFRRRPRRSPASRRGWSRCCLRCRGGQRHPAVHDGDDRPGAAGRVPRIEGANVHAWHAGPAVHRLAGVVEAPELAEVRVVAGRGPAPALDGQVRLGPLHSVQSLEGARRGAGAPALEAEHLGIPEQQPPGGAAPTASRAAARFEADAPCSKRTITSGVAVAGVAGAGARAADAPAAARSSPATPADVAVTRRPLRADRVERERAPLDQWRAGALPPEGRLDHDLRASRARSGAGPRHPRSGRGSSRDRLGARA